MGAKIGHSAKNVEVHEHEIVGCIEQFVFYAIACQKPAQEGMPVATQTVCTVAGSGKETPQADNQGAICKDAGKRL